MIRKVSDTLSLSLFMMSLVSLPTDQCRELAYLFKEQEVYYPGDFSFPLVYTLALSHGVLDGHLCVVLPCASCIVTVVRADAHQFSN